MQFPQSSHSSGRVVVGVDARPLGGPLSGIRRYVQEILRELVEHPGLELVLFSNRPMDLGDIPERLVRRVEDQAIYRRLPGTLWLMHRLPRLLAAHDVLVFWGTQHFGPIRTGPDMKIVISMHDVLQKVYPRSMTAYNRLVYALYYEASANNADYIAALSRSTRDDLARFHGQLAAKPGMVVYPGKSMTGLTPGPSPLAEDYLLLLGSVEPRKNILRFLQVFNILRADFPRLRVVCAGGSGWKNSDIFAYVREHGLENTVLFTGYIPDQLVLDHLAHARLLVLPSLYEGFGLPLLEAVGLCPVVCSDIPVFREASEYLHGLELLDFGQDTRACVDGLRRLLARADPPVLRFRDARAEELFTWRTAAQALASVFINLGASRETRP